MDTLDEHGYSRSHPPELAFLLIVGAFIVGLVLVWPW